MDEVWLGLRSFATSASHRSAGGLLQGFTTLMRLRFKVPFGLGFSMFEGLHGSEGSRSACLINAGAYRDPPR